MTKFIQLSEHHPDSAFLEEHKRMHDVFAWRPKTTWLPPDDYLHEVHARPELPTWFEAPGRGKAEIMADLLLTMPRIPPVKDTAKARRRYNKKRDRKMNKLLRKQGFKVKKLKVKKRNPADFTGFMMKENK